MVNSTFNLFIKLYKDFNNSEKSLEYALNWFLSVNDTPGGNDDAEDNLRSILELDGNQNSQSSKAKINDINIGGLRLSLYALRGHPNQAYQAVLLYDTFCKADE